MLTALVAEDLGVVRAQWPVRDLVEAQGWGFVRTTIRIVFWSGSAASQQPDSIHS
jgi:hypothetical protein